MSAQSKRLSMRSESPLVVTAPIIDSEEWIKAWKEVNAQGVFLKFKHEYLRLDSSDLIVSPSIFSVDAETSVEEACDVRTVFDPGLIHRTDRNH
jgi:hypothetical protein